jgi:4-hydroxyphenylpyruvate dioxygenase
VARDRPLPDSWGGCGLTGIEFVEFAIDEKSAVAFEQTLAGLGFGKAGVHRSKGVTRWRQGDINIVVNADKEGFAHSFNITHGTSVCALALRVDDAAATIDRAIKLLDQPFRQAVGPGEMDIPAVRGLGGSLLYFVDHKSGLDRLWDVDFEQVAENGSDGAGLVCVDHLSQSMHYEEMLTWLLFYTSLLDVRKTPVQTVIDPGGVVQSQVVETPDGSLRLVLNASQSRQTLASRFLNELFGSGGTLRSGRRTSSKP